MKKSHMNKKGMGIQMLGTILGMVLIVVLVIALTFSSTVRIMAISVGVLALSVFMLIKLNTGEKSFADNYFINYIMIVLMISSIGGLVYMSNVQSIGFLSGTEVSIDDDNKLVLAFSTLGTQEINFDVGANQIEGKLDGKLVNEGVSFDMSFDSAVSKFTYTMSKTETNTLYGFENYYAGYDTVTQSPTDICKATSKYAQDEYELLRSYQETYFWSKDKVYCIFKVDVGYGATWNSLHTHNQRYTVTYNGDTKRFTSDNSYVVFDDGSKLTNLGDLGTSYREDTPDYKILKYTGVTAFLSDSDAVITNHILSVATEKALKGTGYTPCPNMFTVNGILCLTSSKLLNPSVSGVNDVIVSFNKEKSPDLTTEFENSLAGGGKVNYDNDSFNIVYSNPTLSNQLLTLTTEIRPYDVTTVVAIPEITDISNVERVSGGSATVNFKYTTPKDASFRSKVLCSDGIASGDLYNNLVGDAGVENIASATFNIGNNGLEDVEGSCKLRIESLGNSDYYDEVSFDYLSKKFISNKCSIVGQLECKDGLIQECGADLQMFIQENCDDGCSYSDDGVPSCNADKDCTTQQDCEPYQICSAGKCISNGEELDCGIFGYETEVYEKNWVFGKKQPTGEMKCSTKPQFIWGGVIIALMFVLIVGLALNPNRIKNKSQSGGRNVKRTSSISVPKTVTTTKTSRYR